MSDMVNKRASLDLRRQALEDATVEGADRRNDREPSRDAGSDHHSATAANGGTTLMTIADLGRVRMRVTIDEVEMGNVRVGLPATVAVDAFPGRTFDGILEKIEPQAVVTQGVTFFPVDGEHQQQGRTAHAGNERRGHDKGGGSQERSAGADRRDSRRRTSSRRWRACSASRSTRSRTSCGATSCRRRARREFRDATSSSRSRTSTYEMRLVKTGPTDLKVAQVIDGLKEGDKVVTLGAIITAKPATPPKLLLADNMKRGAAVSRATQAGEAAPPAKQPKPAAKPAQLAEGNEAVKRRAHASRS